MEKSVSVQLRLTPELSAQLKEKAKSLSISMSSLICMYCSKQLESERQSAQIIKNIEQGKFSEETSKLLMQLTKGGQNQ